MKRAFYGISRGLGMDRAFGYINRRRPLVLVFHGVTDEAPGGFHNADGAHLYRPIFRTLMRYIAEHHRPVPLLDVARWLDGDATLPDRAVAITFDDGYRNVLTQAVPELTELGIPSTVFIVTDFVKERTMLWPDRITAAFSATRLRSLQVDHVGIDLHFRLDGNDERRLAAGKLIALCKSLADEQRTKLVRRILELLEVDETTLWKSWDDYRPLEEAELRELAGYGVEVGSHTCSHPILASCDAEQMSDELRTSKRLIEEMTGRECSAFSYPNGAIGDFNGQTKREVRAAGYRFAVTTVKRRVDPADDPFEIPRATITHNSVTVSEFAVEMSGFANALRVMRDRLAPGRA